MKIAITGSSGFIGSYLVEALKNEHNIVVYDSKNINQILEEFVNNIDLIFHLAYYEPIVLNSERYRQKQNIDNRIIDYCKKTGKRLIFTSSYDVYGDRHNQSEDEPINLQQILDIENYYAYDKIKIENKMRRELTNYVIYRVGWVSGYTKRYINLFYVILNAKLNNHDSIDLNKSSISTDTYINVKDVVDVLVKSIITKNYGVYNLANPHNVISYGDIEDTIDKKVINQTKIVYGSKNNECKVPNVDKIINDKIYFPKRDIDVIINDCLGEPK